MPPRIAANGAAGAKGRGPLRRYPGSPPIFNSSASPAHLVEPPGKGEGRVLEVEAPEDARLDSGAYTKAVVTAPAPPTGLSQAAARHDYPPR